METTGFTYSKHLHEQLLLLLLRLRLRVLVHLEAAGRQETVVVVEEDRTPELLLEEAKELTAEEVSPSSVLVKNTVANAFLIN